MKYIDKSINESAGKQVVDALLNNCWDPVDTIYKAADYDGLCKPPYRNPILSLMLGEQSNLCCYCMKEISSRNTTLEHIIPHKINVGDFPAYLTTSELIDNVIHKEDFDKRTRIIPPAQYPHDIAYHNLIASCDSNLHCNNYRSNKKIAPLIFDANIETLVEYDKAGNTYSEKYENDLGALGLSLANSPLRLIRMIWYKLSQRFDDISQINDEVINDEIYGLILLFNGTKVIENFTGKPSYEEEVLKYKWFFQYYKSII
ncbi:hypothetical protein F0L74_08880 [Chitinophaga agrisoli]|uniref:TIGR02646 family protein n=1 Tax=Chitinophaga agrisoli TaxID=2607653 RepID=A0A5B2VVP5_9BACT|nr:hypothetical protein [Chitinophaga agrisoli]KAA2242638.1 hypothetical protein F0L74_08880 [Chitinophaga agrisoli]